MSHVTFVYDSRFTFSLPIHCMQYNIFCSCMFVWFRRSTNIQNMYVICWCNAAFTRIYGMYVVNQCVLYKITQQNANDNSNNNNQQ